MYGTGLEVCLVCGCLDNEGEKLWHSSMRVQVLGMDWHGYGKNE
jgi:hypothetical protein